MSNEQAQRLVAMSLSKIQSARGRRTGLNLHRSLLVSTVLFKAKTAIIMAKYNMKSEYETTDTEDEYYEDNTDDSDEEEEQSPEIADDAQVVPDLDKDNESGSCDVNIYDSAEEDKENSAPKVISAVSSDIISEQSNQDIRCNKCVKRRLTEVESAVESITKKQCTEEDNCITSDSESSQHEAMECGQMTTLVDSFHCGFSGLLSVNHSYNTAPSDNDACASQGQGLSEAFNSCSTQIKESFDTLSSPIMLSV